MAASARSGERTTLAARVPTQRADWPATSPPRRAERASLDVGGWRGSSGMHPSLRGAPPDGPSRYGAGVIRAFGPGRVNLIGEHTDYNGGLALPFAIARGVTVEAEPRDGGEIRVHARDPDERDAFAGRATRARADGLARLRARHGRPSCARPASTCRARELRVLRRRPAGLGALLLGRAGGGAGLALLELAGAEEPDRVELARLCSRVENDWVGAETGLLDQLAALCCEPGDALRIDFATLELERVPLDLRRLAAGDARLGRQHEHAAGGYNERRAECRADLRARSAIEHLSRADPDAAGALPDAARTAARATCSPRTRASTRWSPRCARATSRDGRPAARRVAREPARRLRGERAGGRGRRARRCKEAGAAGARMVGGGFGGSVLALFPPGGRLVAGALAVEPGPAAALV